VGRRINISAFDEDSLVRIILGTALDDHFSLLERSDGNSDFTLFVYLPHPHLQVNRLVLVAPLVLILVLHYYFIVKSQLESSGNNCVLKS